MNNEMIQAQSGAHDRRKERREEDESEVTIGYGHFMYAYNV